MRSLLFVPGDSEKKLAKAPEAGADAVIIDLEDSVAPAAKRTARALAAAWAASQAAETSARAGDGPKRHLKRYVRINPPDSPEGKADIAAVVGAGIDGIMVPKVTRGDQLVELGLALDLAESRADVPVGTIRLVALITERPEALLRLETFLEPGRRLEALTWGAEDLSAIVGASATRHADGTWRSPYRLARDLTLFTAAGAGVGAIDTVYTNFRDLEGLRREAEAAAIDGFAGKMAIHPAQVPVINAAFTPHPREVEGAEKVVQAFEASGEAGVVQIDGEMFDRPHLVRAERILARHRAAEGR